MADNFTPLTPEQCLAQDVIAAIEAAEDAEIPFEEIQNIIMITLAECDPSQHYEAPNMSGTEPNPYKEIY